MGPPAGRCLTLPLLVTLPCRRNVSFGAQFERLLRRRRGDCGDKDAEIRHGNLLYSTLHRTWITNNILNESVSCVA